MFLRYDVKPVLVTRITYIAHMGKKENFYQREHRHDPIGHEIIFLDYGEIFLQLDGQIIVLAPGECIFIPGGAKHSFRGKEGIPFNFLNIMYRGELPPSITRKKINVSGNDRGLLDKLKHESVQGMPYSNELMTCCLTELIINIIRRTELSLPKGKPDGSFFRPYQSEIVNRALSVIANEYSTPLDIKKLSKAIGIGESSLRGILKKETGQSFISLLHERRIDAAKHFLAESTFTLGEIASATGYRSQSFFFKIFKRQTGMTPKEYALSLGDPEF